MCKSCACKYIGKKIYGYCNGFFSKNEYGNKIIEAVGSDWIIARDSEGIADVALFDDTEMRDSYLKDWMKKDND